MNSQRLREQRIDERLQGGALALATPSDTVQATPTSDRVCQGCLEPNADARVGDQPWHRLCGLYWQGRSEVVRSERIPHTPAGPGITPARSRWVIVVPVGRADLSFATNGLSDGDRTCLSAQYDLQTKGV